MESGQLTVLVLACVWMSEIASQNHVGHLKEQKADHLLLINEVNADNPGDDTMEYLELYHTSGRQARLDSYHLVFYNGKVNQAYKVLDLLGFSTDDEGFFLIGSSSVVPKPSIILQKNTIQNGPDAIALYYGMGHFYENMNITSKGLVDALVHKSKKSDRADELVRILTPGVEPFLEDPFFRTTDESLERCQGADSQWFFQTGAPTPGSDNHCIPFSQLNASVVLINEVHLVSSPGEFEFVELQGPPSADLRDLVLVLIEGTTRNNYFAMEVHGKTSPDGLLLIGPAQTQSPVDLPFPANSSSPLLKAGANAVALYRGVSSSFAVGAAASVENLLDALVYTTTEGTDSELRNILTPGRPIFYVRKRSQQGDISVNRCVCCSITHDPTIYALGPPSPRQFNDCPRKRFSQEISVCLQVSDCQREPPEVQIQMSLAQALDKQCSCGVSPAYLKDPVVTCNGTQLVFTALMTARSAEQLNSQLQAISVFLESKRVMRFGSWNGTVARSCSGETNGTEVPPGPSEKPGTTEEPPVLRTELLINEVNPDNPGAREDTEYIELFHPGQAPFDLHGYWLVLFNGKNNLAYKVVSLTGHRTNEQGYFLVGSSGVTPKPSIVLPSNTIQNGVDAVALYHSTTVTYRTNMPVTDLGLVDAVVYKSRGSEKADKLVAVLVPGQGILHENDSHSSEDESLSRCHSLRPRNHSSFQVTVITPFQENACPPLRPNSTEGAPSAHPVTINEIGLGNATTVYQFIELKGKAGGSLEGYTLVCYSGQDAKPFANISLQGTFGSNGLFVILPEGQSRPGKAHEQMVVSSLWNQPLVPQEPQAVVVFSYVPLSTLILQENLEDAVVYVQEPNISPGHLAALGPAHVVTRRGGRPVSLSSCSSCSESFVVSDPTPGLENSCPNHNLSVDLGMCLLTPDCSFWSLNSVVLAGLQTALIQSMEESCSCGISSCLLQGLNFTCLNSTLKLSGQVWAWSPEQLQFLGKWKANFSANSHPFPVDGRLLRANADCSSPSRAKQRPEASFQAWGVALITLGSILTALVLIGVIFYFIKRRPQNYTTIEMNDRYETMADI
ncbi:uncharacterized protein LOC128336551 isoform X2 [Hemicordylus capensis]|uniref:uncharacterized protein LOC128336551 isoform X2 n=1 Tax=Hemicordylus capensis TaxID=884348 RepID=UPI002303626F|nr:uncharacterized protein LOC128336551 isoform X2 [Hemicordylus capensis]